MKFISKIVRLEFIAPFEISKMVRSHQDVLRIEIHQDGLVGYGETPAIPYYGKDVTKMNALFEAAIPKLEMINWTSPEEWYPALLNCLPSDSFVRSAVDAAAWDLMGKIKGVLVWKYLGLNNPSTSAPSNFTIGIGTLEYVTQEIKNNPWPVYKLKLGAEEDHAVLTAISTTSDCSLRLDANGAWTAEKTKRFLKFCESNLPRGFVELIEEPYQNLDLKGLSELKRSSNIPFFADESFQAIEDLEKIGDAYHGINIKLDKCGGLTPALEIIKKAKKLGLKIQLGCMSSSGISLAPAIQISSLADVIDLDATMLVKDADFGVYYKGGVAMMKGKVGHGIVVK